MALYLVGLAPATAGAARKGWSEAFCCAYSSTPAVALNALAMGSAPWLSGWVRLGLVHPEGALAAVQSNRPLAARRLFAVDARDRGDLRLRRSGCSSPCHSPQHWPLGACPGGCMGLPLCGQGTEVVLNQDFLPAGASAPLAVFTAAAAAMAMVSGEGLAPRPPGRRVAERGRCLAPETQPTRRRRSRPVAVAVGLALQLEKPRTEGGKSRWPNDLSARRNAKLGGVCCRALAGLRSAHPRARWDWGRMAATGTRGAMQLAERAWTSIQTSAVGRPSPPAPRRPLDWAAGHAGAIRTACGSSPQTASNLRARPLRITGERGRPWD